MKLLARDIVKILDSYGLGGEDASPEDIKNLKALRPDGSHSRLDFDFARQKYSILVDNTADSDKDYIKNQLEAEAGLLLDSKIDNQPKLVYRGKDIYLLKRSPDSYRLDAYLAAHYPEKSRTFWAEIIKSGAVLVNGQAELTLSRNIKDGDKVEAELPEDPDFSHLSLPVIYEDADIIVINKPAGVLSHAKGAHLDEFTVADFFKRHTSWQQETNRAGIIHRLDRGTSGVMVGAKNQVAGKYIQKQFSLRRVKKTYQAVVEGVLAQPEALIDLPIERNPQKPSQFRVGASGKPAQTRYKTLLTNGSESLVELYPVTGRTHQLRVHLAYLGAPIKGDHVYGKSNQKTKQRLYLHATSLEFTRPDRVRDVFNSSTPDCFMEFFEKNA